MWNLPPSDTVLHLLALKLPDGHGLAVQRVTDQVMPAENLVQHDAVGQAAEADAEHEPGADEGVFQRGAHGGAG